MEKSRSPDDFYDWHQVPIPPKVPCPLCGIAFIDGEPLISHVEACIETYENARPQPPPNVRQQEQEAAERRLREDRERQRRLDEENERLLKKMLEDEKKIEKSPPFPPVKEKVEDNEKLKVFDPFLSEYEKQRKAEEEENERLFQKFLKEEKEREMAQRDKEPATEFNCAICKKNFPFGHFDALFLDECMHYTCKSCLKQFAQPLISAKKLSALRCQLPDCKKPLSPPDLSQAEYERYLDLTFQQTVEDSNQFVSCVNPACRNIIERIAAAERSNLTVSAEISYFKEQYRFRCNACQTEFCSNCHESPYHESFTCDQFKERKLKKKCRFCHAPIVSPDKDVCASKDCQEKRKVVCDKKLPCGHQCSGVFGETECLPCLQEECTAKSKLNQNGNDYCNICWVESLDSAPSLQLKCGHIFHFQCVRKQLEGRWNSAHVAFGFMDCPLCQSPIEHDLLKATLDPLLELRTDIQNKALQRLKFLNLEGVKEIATDVNGPFYKKPSAYALKRFCYYVCFKCKKPYFGGERSCNAEQRAEDYDPKELVCATCSGAGKGSECPLHKNDYIAWKCKFCCNVAAWFCWGTTHFCDGCHKNHATVTKTPKEKLPPCSCKIPHPPNGDEYCIGCSLCQLEPKDF